MQHPFGARLRGSFQGLSTDEIASATFAGVLAKFTATTAVEPLPRELAKFACHRGFHEFVQAAETLGPHDLTLTLVLPRRQIQMEIGAGRSSCAWNTDTVQGCQPDSHFGACSKGQCPMVQSNAVRQKLGGRSGTSSNRLAYLDSGILRVHY